MFESWVLPWSVKMERGTTHETGWARGQLNRSPIRTGLLQTLQSEPRGRTQAISTLFTIVLLFQSPRDEEEERLLEQLHDIQRQYDRLLQQMCTRPCRRGAWLPDASPPPPDRRHDPPTIELSAIGDTSQPSLRQRSSRARLADTQQQPLHSTIMYPQSSTPEKRRPPGGDPEQRGSARGKRLQFSPPAAACSPLLLSSIAAATPTTPRLARRRSRRYRAPVTDRRARRRSAPVTLPTPLATPRRTDTIDCPLATRPPRQQGVRQPPDGLAAGATPPVTVTPTPRCRADATENSDATRFMEHRLNPGGVAATTQRLERRGSMARRLRSLGRKFQRIRQGNPPMKTLALIWRRSRHR